MSEKSFVNFRFEVRNKGGHSSIPVPDNAIYHLAGALERLSKFEFPLKTNDVTRTYFEQMGNLEASAVKRDLTQVGGGSMEAMKRVAAASPTWNSMLRTTCVATVLEGGHAVNALPQLAAANVNCRILPEDSTEYVQSTLKKVVADDQVKLTLVEDDGHSPILPVSPEVMQGIRKVSQTLWPGVPIVPTMSTGATDGRYLRVAGIPTFGIQGFFIDRDDVRAHGRDERMGVEAFYEGQNFLYELVKTLAKQ
jgi:acetylornithine deacetylase/succinyl-diaminopimelate desuccinylase-like protein